MSIKQLRKFYQDWSKQLLINKPQLWASGLHYMVPIVLVWAGLIWAFSFFVKSSLVELEEFLMLIFWPTFLIFGFWLFPTSRVPKNIHLAASSLKEQIEAMSGQLAVLSFLLFSNVGFYYHVVDYHASKESVENIDNVRFLLQDPKGALTADYDYFEVEIPERIQLIRTTWDFNLKIIVISGQSPLRVLQ